MSTAEQSRVYRFRDDVALTLHTRDSSGYLDIRTAYVRPAHALRLACDLIRAAIDCAEQPEERSACGTVERVANDCDNVTTAMEEVVQLIDREATGAGNMSSRDRQILGQIIDGLREVERYDGSADLDHLTVAMADEDGKGLGKYPVDQALDILQEALHMDIDGVDVSRRAMAEVWPSIDGPLVRFVGGQRVGGSSITWEEDEEEPDDD